MTLLILCVILILTFFESANCVFCHGSDIEIPFRQYPEVDIRQIDYGHYFTGMSFTPPCQRDYRPNGKFVCKNGVWSGHFPPCVRVSKDDCNMPPPSISNGEPEPHKIDHLARVEYECNEHYFPLTESTVKCSYGKWIGTPPHCKDGRCKFADLKGKEGVVASLTYRTLSGHDLIFQCAPGFDPVAGVNPWCYKGSWVEDEPSLCKENNCTVPDIPHGDLMEVGNREVFVWKKLRWENKAVLKKVEKGLTVPVGRKLTLACDYKYAFEGKGERNVEVVCSRGMWVPSPLCEQ